MIATYLLCSFSSVGAVGLQLGVLGALAPSRRKDCALVVIRALIAGDVACFMTACIAGTCRLFPSAVSLTKTASTSGVMFLKKVECVGKNDCEHVKNCDIACISAFIER